MIQNIIKKFSKTGDLSYIRTQNFHKQANLLPKLTGAAFIERSE
ncbi:MULTISPECIES: hypothetical protein [unclassified Flavobacterium]|nr:MULTISPECIES: hypothetical protein [unclassified Flavobacterium]